MITAKEKEDDFEITQNNNMGIIYHLLFKISNGVIIASNEENLMYCITVPKKTLSVLPKHNNVSLPQTCIMVNTNSNQNAAAIMLRIGL